MFVFSIIILGQAAQNDEIKEELEEIISGLQSYLSHVRQKAQKETVDYNRLLRDREELLHTLADLEKDREQLRKTEAELSLWKQVKNYYMRQTGKRSVVRTSLEPDRHCEKNLENTSKLSCNTLKCTKDLPKYLVVKSNNT